MEVEQVEIREHLRRHPPFSDLTEERLNEVAMSVEVAYSRAGTVILELDTEITDLYFIRSGSVEVFRRNGELYNRLGEGDIFGQLGLMTGRRVRFPVRALEDTLLYCIPESVFQDLFENEAPFADFVEVEDRTRLRQTAASQTGDNPLLTTPVGKMVTRGPVTIPERATVRQAAELMTREEATSILVVAGDGNEALTCEDLLGTITDSDLRRRVVAEGRSFDVPVTEVMSTGLITIDRDQFLFEAMLVMLKHNVHHLPVISRNRPVGVIDLSDIAGHESQSSLFVVRNIFYRDSVESLKRLVPDVRASFVRMVNEDANSHMIGAAMATIGRSFKQRLLELAEEEFGQPPVPYCFLALGSMARDEQFLVTDQDHAMIIDDAFDPDEHDPYFLKLAQFVADGLDALGYPYCKGDVMATNVQLRRPLAYWRKRFSQWIEKPSARGLLNSSIFFDLDGVYGETRLVDQLRQEVVDEASRAPGFLGCLAVNARNRTPPLGFFKDFVLEKGGRHQDSINLKRRGTAPLVDVIRVHALASASRAQNSFRRLDDAVASGYLTASMAADLRDALEFISVVRARHQAYAVEQGEEPDNNIDPESLSGLERRSLKDAFKVLGNAQKFLKFRYRPAR